MAQRTKEVQRVKAAASFAELYGRLNDGQRAAVDAIEGPVMVLAGPGTGKTQVLTMRVANILQRTDMAPWNILCLTFTESAALEMRQRLLKIIGEAAYQVRISTFHAFCNDVIQDWPEKFPFSGSEVLAEVERVEVFRRLLDQLLGTSALKPFGQPYLFLPDVMRAVQLLKQESITVERAREAAVTVRDFLRQSAAARTAFIRLRPAERDAMAVAAVREQLRAATDHEALRELIDQPFVRLQEAVALAENKREEGKARTALKNSLQRLFDKWERHAPRQIELLNVYDAYQAWLDQHSRFDYEDMIMRVVEALQGDDALLAHYQEQFQYVLVDEFQDTNGSQNEVVRLLGSFYPNPNIFVVGDDKQSIFRFQGASLENLLNFYERYRADVQIISLHDNYRSGQLILDAAGAVITHNRSLLARHVPNVTEELRARTDTPASLAWYAFDTEDEENFFVATTIQGLLEVGVAADEIAVLYRFNRDADSLVDLLLRMRVPVRLEAGENVLQDPRVRQFLQLLTFIAQPHRSDVLADILQFDFLSLNALDVLRVIHAAAERGGRRALLEVLASESELTGAGVREPARFVQLATQLAQWHQLHTNCTLVQLFDVVLSESGLLDFILREEHNLPILHRLSTLYQELVRLNRAQHDLRAADFVSRLNVLQESGLALTASPWQTRKAAVRLMTAHKAKGREFQHVFIMRLRDKHWGNVRERARVELPPGLLRHDLVPGQSGNEDERRLFYVALTRAKQRLYLSYAHLDAAGREQAESQFVRELPAGLVEVVDTVPTEEAAAVRLSTARLAPATVVAADVREWLGECLQHYVMSVTHLNNYLTCPRLFYYRNLIRVPSAKTKHMAFGTAVHRALRDFATRHTESGVLPAAAYLPERFAVYLAREVLSPTEAADSLAVGQEALRAWWQQYQQDFSGALARLPEYDFRSHGVALGDLPLTGLIDNVAVIDATKKLAIVTDYKTGNPDNAYRHLKEGGDYRRQLTFYKLLAQRSPRFGYEIVRGEIDFIQPSKRTGKFVKKAFEISDTDVAALEQQIKDVWTDIKALKFLDVEGCGECEYCQRF